MRVKMPFAKAQKWPLYKRWTSIGSLVPLAFLSCVSSAGLAKPISCNGILSAVIHFLNPHPNPKTQSSEWTLSLTEDLEGSAPEVYSLREKYIGEEVGGKGVEERTHFKQPVQYLTKEQAVTYQLRIKDGIFYDVNTRVLCPTNYCEGIIVVDANGQIFFSTFSEKGKFHHSSLVQGRPVLFAGDAVFKDGLLKVIDNQSGHYHPEVRAFKFLIQALKNAQVTDYIVGIPYRDLHHPDKLHEHMYFHAALFEKEEVKGLRARLF